MSMCLCDKRQTFTIHNMCECVLYALQCPLAAFPCLAGIHRQERLDGMLTACIRHSRNSAYFLMGQSYVAAVHTHTHKHTHTHTHCTVRKFWGFNILSTTQDYLKMKHVSRMCICRERMWIVPEYDGFVDETVLFIPCTVFAKLCQI